MKNKLKDIREQKKLTQEQFAKWVGISSQPQYARIENGGDIKLSTASKIAKILKMSIQDIWEV